MVVQAVYVRNGFTGSLAAGPVLIPNPPTNWFWNVRIGDRFRFDDSGRYYTVVGPMTIPNPENFVNDGPPNVSPYATPLPSLEETYGPAGNQVNVHPEFLFLVNGVDDNNDGFIDNGFDGINNNRPSICTSTTSSSGRRLSSTERRCRESSSGWAFKGRPRRRPQTSIYPPTFKYTITAAAGAVPGATEVALPGGAVIDLTTWDHAVSERSRLPVDPFSHNVDILLNQAGRSCRPPSTRARRRRPWTGVLPLLDRRPDRRVRAARLCVPRRSPTLPMPSDALNSAGRDAGHRVEA